MDGTDLCPIAELQHGGDQAYSECREELVDVVHPRIVDVADEEPEVERRREQYEEAEDDLFEIHAPPAGQVAAWQSMSEVLKLSHAKLRRRPIGRWPSRLGLQPVRRSRASITVRQT